ncbi:CaiB/BaiF CoA transferase family protein [Mycolicibacterium sp. XJ879]
MRRGSASTQPRSSIDCSTTTSNPLQPNHQEPPTVTSHHPNVGPLAGITVLDVSALGPGPFCSMMLADFGAEVVSISRPGPRENFDPSQFFSRGKQSIVVDIRRPDGAQLIRHMTTQADVFLEGFRPGVMERRGLGPNELMAISSRLVYARLTGYGQNGPLSQSAGHDINYLASAGLLGTLGDEQNGPAIPLNLLGDFASGSMSTVLGITLALIERQATGRGQIVDAAMVDGAAALLSAQLAEFSAGLWHGPGTSLLSGRAPHYAAYRCSDGGWFAVGAIEDRFYAQMVSTLGLDINELPDRSDRANWDDLRDIFASCFAARTRAEWTKEFSVVDGCGSAVLRLDELADDPHLQSRKTVYRNGNLLEPAPAPRLSGFAPPVRQRVAAIGQDTRAVLRRFGVRDSRIDELERQGVVEQADS